MPDDFIRLGELMPTVPGGTGPALEPASGNATRASSGPTREVALAWPEIVGEDAAANSQPVRLRHGRLIVATSSSAWAQTLQFMEETVKGLLNERLGASLVERIQFRHAGWQEWPREAMPRAPEPAAGRGPDTATRQPVRRNQRCDEAPSLSPEQEEALQAVQRMGLDPLLEKRIVGAMRAAFVRSQQDSVR